MDEPLIAKVIHLYHPAWVAPKPGRFEWLKTCCPWHGDEIPSASVSYERNAFRCHSCGMKGDAYSIISRQEGISYQEAYERATGLSYRSDEAIPPSDAGKPRRRIFAGSGNPPVKRGGRTVSSRPRRRTFGGT